MTIDLTTLTLRDAISGLERHEFNAVELIEATLQRIEATEPAVHAYVEVYAGEARDAAREADRVRDAEKVRRPLLGIPLGIKDIFDVAGKQTLCGAKQRAEVGVARNDALAVSYWRRDGAIFTGKTVTQEYAAGVVSDPARNPWDIHRVPGGSSGGSAAAVAVGSCLGAMGSDTGGSIRIPAAVTGTVGLKPTFGRIPATGVYPLSPSLDTIGPIARTVADALVLFLSLANRTAEITGVDALLMPEGNRALDGVRIGVLTSFFTENIQPDVAASFADAIRVLRDLGARIIEVDWQDAAAARGRRTD